MDVINDHYGCFDALTLANTPTEHHIGFMLLLKRTMTSATTGEWSDQEFDVFDDDVFVGRILRSQAAPFERPWLWTINSRLPTGTSARGYAGSLETAVAEVRSRWEASSMAPTNSSAISAVV